MELSSVRPDAKSGLVRFVLASVLVVAATLKGLEMAENPLSAGASSLGWLWWIVVVAEIALAIWLVSGKLFKHAQFVALVWFSVLAVAALSEALADQPSCGCFGRVTVNPWITFAFDIVAVATLARSSSVLTSWLPSSRPVRLTLGISMLAVVAGLAATMNYAAILWQGDVVILEPNAWLDQRWPLLQQIDIGADLARGQWKVALVRHDCSHCRELVQTYRRDLSQTNEGLRLATVELPPYAPSGEFEIDGCVRGRLISTERLFVETPIEVYLDDGIVKQVVTQPVR